MIRAFVLLLGIAVGSAADFKILRNLDYVGDGNPRQMLDLYLPVDRTEDEQSPVLVWIHGGAWAKGSKDSPRLALQVAEERSCAIVSINYRLTDEAQWPSQLHDCKAAVRWIRANAKKYKLNSKRIVLWGASAGGHLVSMMGATQDREFYDGSLGEHVGVSTQVAGIVNFFGPTDLSVMNQQGSKMDHDGPQSPEGKLLGGRVSNRVSKAKEASPYHQVNKLAPPFMTVHGTDDPLVPFEQGRALDHKLDELGVLSILITVQNGKHGGGFGPSVASEVRSFLECYLFGQKKALTDKVVEARF